MDIKKLVTKLDALSESPMTQASNNPTGPKFSGYWKGTDSKPPKPGMGVGGEGEESMLKGFERELKENPARKLARDLMREFNGSQNPQDVVKVDVPLLIRLLEFAREDAKTDMDLHALAEKLVGMCSGGNILTMDHYEQLISGSTQTETIEEYGGVGGYGAASQSPQGAADLQNDPAAMQLKTDASQIKKNTGKIASTLNAQGASQPVNKLKFADTLTKLDAKPNTDLSAAELKNIGPLGVAASKALQDPRTAEQFKQVINKAGQNDMAKQQKVKQAQQQIGTNTPNKPGTVPGATPNKPGTVPDPTKPGATPKPAGAV